MQDNTNVNNILKFCFHFIFFFARIMRFSIIYLFISNIGGYFWFIFFFISKPIPKDN